MASNRVMVSIPHCPARIFCQALGTLFPTGQTIPRPVTTTLRFVYYVLCLTLGFMFYVLFHVLRFTFYASCFDDLRFDGFGGRLLL